MRDPFLTSWSGCFFVDLFLRAILTDILPLVFLSLFFIEYFFFLFKDSSFFCSDTSHVSSTPSSPSLMNAMFWNSGYVILWTSSFYPWWHSLFNRIDVEFLSIDKDYAIIDYMVLVERELAGWRRAQTIVVQSGRESACHGSM